MKRFVCLIFCFVGIVILSCTSKAECFTNKTQCSGNVAQICTTSGRWLDFQNCDQTSKQSGGEWKCCALPGGDEPEYTCLPKSSCP